MGPARQPAWGDSASLTGWKPKAPACSIAWYAASWAGSVRLCRAAGSRAGASAGAPSAGTAVASTTPSGAAAAAWSLIAAHRDAMGAPQGGWQRWKASSAANAEGHGAEEPGSGRWLPLTLIATRSWQCRAAALRPALQMASLFFRALASVHGDDHLVGIGQTIDDHAAGRPQAALAVDGGGRRAGRPHGWQTAATEI